MVRLLKIDSKEQMQSFMNSLIGNRYTEEELNHIEQVVDINRIQTFSKKMLLLQWYFFQDTEHYESDSQMYQNALDRHLKNGLIQKLSIESNIGYLKDDWGKDNSREEMRKLAKEGLLIRKNIKNYIITDLGKECAKFIFYKILESLIGIQKLWKLIQLDLTSDNLQKINPDHEEYKGNEEDKE